MGRKQPCVPAGGHRMIPAVFLAVSVSACSYWTETGSRGGPFPDSVPARTVELPTLMGPGLHTQAQICVHARAHQPGMRLALVAVNSHIDDFDSRACLKLTRDLSDSCNGFVHDHFALYHSRLYRNSPDRSHVMEESPVAWDIAEEWSKITPMMAVIDLQTCERIGDVRPGDGEGRVGNSGEPALIRFLRIRDSLLSLPGVRRVVGPAITSLATDYDSRCMQQPEPTILQVWKAMELQQAPTGALSMRVRPSSAPGDVRNRLLFDP